MNKKGSTNIILVIIIVVLLGLVGYFAFVRKPKASLVAQTPPSEPDLSKEIAVSLLLGEKECILEGVRGEYGSCTVDISKEKDRWVVTITYDGLFDDSVKASRMRTIVMYRDGHWVKGETSWTQKCWPGRGRQDFSTELCI